MILSHMNETSKQIGDVVSIGWLIAIFVSNLPTITALLVLVWTLMRIYESWQNIRINDRKLGRGE